MKMSSSVKERNESKNDNVKAVELDKQTYAAYIGHKLVRIGKLGIVNREEDGS